MNLLEELGKYSGTQKLMYSGCCMHSDIVASQSRHQPFKCRVAHLNQGKSKAWLRSLDQILKL